MVTKKLFVALEDMVGPEGSAFELRHYFDEIVAPTKREAAIRELVRLGADVVALIVGVKERVDADVVAGLPNLRILGTISTGTDHLDLDALQQARVSVVTATGINGPAVAEHSLSMILGLLKHSIQSHTASLDGRDRTGLPSFPRELRKCKVSVFGAGATATWLVRLLQPFDCEVMVWTPHPERHEELLNFGARFGEIDELFSFGEVVSFHLPLTETTRVIVTEQRLRSLPERSVIVNTSRKELFDWGALRSVFANRTDLVLGIDDFGLKDDLEGLDQNRLLASPHIAGVTEKSMKAMEDHVVIELKKMAASLD